MSEVAKELELELLTTSALKRRYDKTKSKISELDEEVTLIYREYRRREAESKRISNWMKECIK